MDKGELVEYDVPHMLLCQESSHLTVMVRDSELILASKIFTCKNVMGCSFLLVVLLHITRVLYSLSKLEIIYRKL